MKRFVLLYVAPLVLLLAAVFLPLIRGTETLYLRDVMNSHFPMKWSQAEAMRHGTLPLLDGYRAGGQPIAGNPNAVPFYPTNLLYLVAGTFWAMNAQFWIHLLLAPFAFYWMARSFGLGREPAWAAGACYTLSGFYLSHLSFYNLIAGATLAPALVASCLRLADPRHDTAGRWSAPVTALLWGLIFLGGDPMMALLAFALAGLALLVTWRVRRGWCGFGRFALLAASFAAGSLLALPQIVEFRRILPLSFRVQWGYTPLVATVASWDPHQLVEWAIPFFFGRPDVLGPGSFWGTRYFTDTPPYYLSLYPGLLALGLVAASGRPRGLAASWAWIAALGGLFASLGRFNPLVNAFFQHAGNMAFRYPVKFWLPVAMGAALLCGLGFGRLFEEGSGGAWRRLRFVLGGLALGLGAWWIFLSFLPGPAGRFVGLVVAGQKPPFVANERLRWAGLCLLSLVALLALALCLGWMRRRPAAGGAALLAVHAAVQLFLLRPLFPTDAVKPYLVKPPALAQVPRGLLVVNPNFNYLFGPSSLRQGKFPDPGMHWMERRAFYELYPFSGPVFGLRYELNTAPEGLDTFLARMAQGSLKGATDDQRMQLLAAWGVGRVLTDRVVRSSSAKLLATYPSFGWTLYVWDVPRRSAEAFMARRVAFAPHLNEANKLLLRPDFDPRTDAVIAGRGRPLATAGGSARVLKNEAERVEIDAAAGAGGSYLVVQRANLLLEATVDGKPAPVETANLYRLAVKLPAGRHRVILATDRRPLHRAAWAVLLGLALLPGLALWGGRARTLRPRQRVPDLPEGPHLGRQAEGDAGPGVVGGEGAADHDAPPLAVIDDAADRAAGVEHHEVGVGGEGLEPPGRRLP